MSTEAKQLSSEVLSRAIREKVAEANQLQRHLSEAAIHARAVLSSLRPALDEIGAYMHRETGLDVVSGRQTPAYLTAPFTDTPSSRTAVEFREITVPTEPPTSLLGGFEVEVSTDGNVSILAFWSAGDSRSGVAVKSWTETFAGEYASLKASNTTVKAADALYGHRQLAAQFLLDALNAAQ